MKKQREWRAQMVKQLRDSQPCRRLANPFRWDCVFETDRATYRFDLGLTERTRHRNAVRYEKPAGELEAVMNTVSQQRAGAVFLGFARFPVMQLADPGCTTRTLVQLADLRYTEPGRSRGSFSLEVADRLPDRTDQEDEREPKNSIVCPPSPKYRKNESARRRTNDCERTRFAWSLSRTRQRRHVRCCTDAARSTTTRWP